MRLVDRWEQETVTHIPQKNKKSIKTTAKPTSKPANEKKRENSEKYLDMGEGG